MKTRILSFAQDHMLISTTANCIREWILMKSSSVYKKKHAGSNNYSFRYLLLHLNTKFKFYQNYRETGRWQAKQVVMIFSFFRIFILKNLFSDQRSTFISHNMK